MGRPQIHHDTTRINLHLPNKLLAAAKALCASRGTSLTEVTRTALREYLIRELKLERDLADAQASSQNRVA